MLNAQNLKQNIKRIILLLILVLAAILRIGWLNEVPHSINNDELHYLFSAKSFYLTGKDITQTASLIDIFTFHYPSEQTVQAELPYLLEIISVGSFPFSLIGNALPNALLGIMTILIIYLIAKEFFHNEYVALVSAFLASVNPWFVIMGRTSYEIIPMTFFFLCAFYILMKAKNWAILLVFPILLLAFYSYIGTKLIFLPLVIAFISYSYFFIHKPNYKRQYAILIALSIGLLLFFLYQLHQFPQNSRTSEILTPFSKEITQQVDDLRKNTIDQPLLSIFINKPTILAKILLTNTFNILSPNYLFMQGDSFFSNYQHGLFYPLDILFLIIGSTALYLRKKKLFIFMFALILISIIPQILHDHYARGNFSPHIALMVPFFIIIMSYGIVRLFTFLQKIKVSYLIALICFIYIFLIGNLFNTYLFQMSISNNFFNFPDRVFARYIELVELKYSDNQPIIVYTENQKDLFKEYIFYNNLYNVKNIPTIAKKLDEANYSLDNVTFLSCNQKLNKLHKQNLTIIDSDCGMPVSKEYASIKITRLTDNSEAFAVINDRICQNYKLNNYIYDLQINDFNVDKFSQKSFCVKFLTIK